MTGAYEYRDSGGETIQVWPTTDCGDPACVVSIEVNENGRPVHLSLAEGARLIGVLSLIVTEAAGRAGR